ncbi:MAG: S41 family peptidase [Luteitalea sp.]
MLWHDRVYFVSDRDGSMNLWSMTASGDDLRQHTRHRGFDVQDPALAHGRIAYQLGADLRLLDLASNSDEVVPIRLLSDSSTGRERVMTSPLQWVSSAHLSPSGDRLVLTARGQIFVVPATAGAAVPVARAGAVRYRDARFLPDGRSLVALADVTGEFELWRLPADGRGTGAALTTGATVLRHEGLPSPDGRHVASQDKDLRLWLHDLRTGVTRLIAESANGEFRDLRWSPDGRWLAYVQAAANDISRIWIYGVSDATTRVVTTDRFDSFSPAWSPDGDWLSFLSDRHFESTVTSPWGGRQPEPHFDRQTNVYQLALRPGVPWPFALAEDRQTAARAAVAADGPRPSADAPGAVTIEFEGLPQRLYEVPLVPGNYSSLETDGKRLYFLAWDASPAPSKQLKVMPIDGRRVLDTVMSGVQRYELSLDRRVLLLSQGDALYVLPSDGSLRNDLSRARVDLSGWTVRVNPHDEWRQMFVDAWRMQRDYFYDREMHGVDWAEVRARYEPLVSRVTDRAELSDLIAQMVGELSALHMFVRGGDLRTAPEAIDAGSLGAAVERDERAGGYRITHIYRGDPDLPDQAGPLARPQLDVREGDLIVAVDGVSTRSVPDFQMLLRNAADRRVRLRVTSGDATTRDLVVTAVSLRRELDLRYSEWEYGRRQQVEARSEQRIGYVHLRGMTAVDMADWQRNFYPVYKRAGLIVDLRRNTGGNIDSWLLSRLLRQAWFFWQPRVGQPSWNMPYAFRGHLVVLVDQDTASDGEAFAEGVKRMGLGTVIGTRTWGGEIWGSGSNALLDRGIATAPETGVFGPDGLWLIEGHGVDPDIVVDNPPHATFTGEDAQLDAALEFLSRRIAEQPLQTPVAPVYPDKRAPLVTSTTVGSPSLPPQ